MVTIVKGRPISPGELVSWLNAYIDDGGDDWNEVYRMLSRVDFNEEYLEDFYGYTAEIPESMMFGEPDII